MPAAHTPQFWTAEMVQALPHDGNRYETVHGTLIVTPPPRMWHEIIVMRLTERLHEYLAREPVGFLFSVPADISWSPDTLVQPDVFVAPHEEVRTLDWSRVRTLLLVAEVLSPGTERGDRQLKRPLYQSEGVPLTWIIDAERGIVEAWAAEARQAVIERERLAWHPAGAATACVLALEDLFREV